MNVVILAPHQDDEILSAYLYLKHLKLQSNNVSVVFVTNGDFKGRDIAILRAQESINALSSIGITAEDIYFMGYADTGMRQEDSFLFKLYNSPAEQAHVSPYSNMTYNPIGEDTVHSLIYGEEAFYTRDNFVTDLKGILQILQPQILIAPSKYDYHGDHKMLGLFISEIMVASSEFKCTVYSYLVHSGNDWTWPNHQSSSFHYPPNFPKALWNTRIIFQFTPKESIKKLEVIQGIITQSLSDLNGFLYRFSKEQEVFFLENNINQPK